MPAAAVIPAPVAYINVVAVKKLVVGFLCEAGWVWLVPVFPPFWGGGGCEPSARLPARHVWSGCENLFSAPTSLTVKKLECSKQAMTARIVQHGMTMWTDVHVAGGRCRSRPAAPALYVSNS